MPSRREELERIASSDASPEERREARIELDNLEEEESNNSSSGGGGTSSSSGSSSSSSGGSGSSSPDSELVNQLEEVAREDGGVAGRQAGEALQQIQEQGYNEQLALQDKEGLLKSDRVDDSISNVVASGDPSEGEDVQSRGQGDTLEEARKAAAENPEFDADAGTPTNRKERALGTNQPLQNIEGSTPDEIQTALEDIAGSDRFRGERRGRRAGRLARTIEEGQEKFNEIDITREGERIQVVGRNRNTVNNTNEGLTSSSSSAQDTGLPGIFGDAATDLDNYLTGQSRNSFQEISDTAQTARQTNRELDPNSLSPVSITAKGFAGGESFISEGAEALTSDQGFNLSEARTVSEGRVRELQGTIGEVSAPVQRPLETANLLTSATPRTITSQWADDRNQKASDVDFSSAINFASASATQAKDNPTEFALGATLSGGLERTTSTSIRRASSSDIPEAAADRTGEALKRADPATGFGRTRRPGELTPTTSELIGEKLSDAKDFVSGDLGTTQNRRPDARNLVIDTDPDSPTFENQEAVEQRFPDPSRLDNSADRIVIDERGNIPIEVNEVTRRDVVSDKISSSIGAINERLDGGAVGSGPGALLKKSDFEDNTPSLDDSDFVRRIDSQDRRQDVEPDSLEGRILRDRRSRRSRRSDRREFNRPDSDTEVSLQEGLGLGAGLGQSTVDVQNQSGRVNQDQSSDITVDELVEEGQLPGQRGDNDNRDQPDLTGDQMFEDEALEINRNDLDRRGGDTNRAPDVGMTQDNSSEEDLLGSVVSDEQEFEFSSSVGAELLDISSDSMPSREEASNPLNLRPQVD